MWCPYCKKPSVFREDYSKNEYTCNECGKTFSGDEMREYGLYLQSHDPRRDISPEEWRDFEDGWRPF